MSSYLELSKSRIVLMVLVTTAGGYVAAGHFHGLTFAAVLAGTALLAAGTNAMNEVLERDYDALMQRTAGRPIPSGRISSRAALAFALGTAIAGTLVLLTMVNILTSVAGALTFLSYNFVYTPLKRVTPACTVIGAIPGAAGPLIGWTAATNEIGVGGALVFAILFLWQLPHFMAISWTHRQDYARAGFEMLSVRDQNGIGTARRALLYSMLLMGVSPFAFPRARIAAVLAAAALVVASVVFLRERTARNARRLFMTSNVYLIGAMLLLLFASCERKQNPQEATHETTKGLPSTQSTGAPTPAASAVIIGNLKHPETALWLPKQDVYLISNINGAELAVDDNGFITRVDPNTGQTTLQWIQAGKNGVHLDRPMGMALLGNTLYVCDAMSVRKFDVNSGAPQGEIAFPGATFINDIASNGKDALYVTDTGIVPGPGRSMRPTGSAAIYKIVNDKPMRIASGKDLEEPNGVEWYDGKVYVVSFGSNQLYTIDDHGKKDVVGTLPFRQLDGLEVMGDGNFLVSSWEGQGIYEGSGSSWKKLSGAVVAPAGIGWDAKRRRVLVPTGNEVDVASVP